MSDAAGGVDDERVRQRWAARAGSWRRSICRAQAVRICPAPIDESNRARSRRELLGDELSNVAQQQQPPAGTTVVVRGPGVTVDLTV